MYKKKSICVIIPTYNEERKIESVIKTLPNFIDEVVVVDDKSTDATPEIVEKLQKKHKTITLIRRIENGGAGAAKKAGYIYARKTKHDIFITVDGDGQMDPADIIPLIGPIVKDDADFTKANRLIHEDAYKIMPKYRFWGNAVLTLLTKIASGYWHITDAQTGFTACNQTVVQTLPFEKLYEEYGYPNHLLVLLNIHNFRVRDIPCRPVYGVGENSHIRVRRVVFRISWLLWRSFCWRMKEKYMIRDFHPLIFFYLGGFGCMLVSLVLGIRMVIQWILTGRIPPINALAFMTTGLACLQLLLFAMWFDMQSNKDLK